MQTIARGEDLPLLVEMAGLQGHESVLDVGTASGTAALALAERTAGVVVGIDMAPALLEQAAAQAAIRSLRNTHFLLGDAGALPFEDSTFDLVVTRMAGHHFPDMPSFCREATRVLRQGGRLVVFDNVAPEDPEQDAFINDLELLRDPSHARAHRVSEWLAALSATGLALAEQHLFLTPEPLPDWTDRLGVAPEVALEIQRRLATAPEAIRAAFHISTNGLCIQRAALLTCK